MDGVKYVFYREKNNLLRLKYIAKVVRYFYLECIFTGCNKIKIIRLLTSFQFQ